MEYSSWRSRTNLSTIGTLVQLLCKLALSFFIMIGLFGCSNDNSVKNGRILTERYEPNARICVDTNKNFQCDENELQTQSNSEGEFQIKVHAGEYLLAEIPYPEGYQKNNIDYKMHYLVKEFDQMLLISPFSSLLAYLRTQEPDYETFTAEQTLTELFSIESSLLLSDYVQARNTNAIELSKMLRYAQLFYTKSMSAHLSAEKISGYANAMIIDHAKRITLHAAAPILETSNYSATSTTNRLISANWQEGMGYGRGYDSLKEQAINGSTCVDFNASMMPTTQCSQDQSYTFTLIESESELYKAFHLGARISLDVVVATASGSIDSLTSSMKQRNKLYVMTTKNNALCTYERESFTLRQDKKALFASDYNAFRTACGDAYLASIQSGGFIVGLFQLDYENDQHKKELTESLKAKVLGVTVYHHTWKNSVDTLFSEMKARYVVHSNFFTAKSDYDTNSQDFYAYFEKYDAKLNSSDCNQDNGLEKCKYLAYFYDYGSLGSSYAARIDDATAILEDYNTLAENYDILDQNLQFIETHSALYPNYTKSNATKARGEIIVNKTILSRYASKCEDNTSLCEPIANLSDLNTTEAITANYHIPQTTFLPFLTCNELFLDSPSLGNNLHTLYAERNLSKPFYVYCEADADDYATLLPLTHHELGTLGSLSYLRYNYALAQGLQESTSKNNYTMATLYDRINIVPCSPLGECFTVDVENSRPLASIIMPQTTTQPLFNHLGTPYSYVPYATPYRYDTANLYGPSKANLDFSDTNFTLKNSPLYNDVNVTLIHRQDTHTWDIFLGGNADAQLSQSLTLIYR